MLHKKQLNATKYVRYKHNPSFIAAVHVATLKTRTYNDTTESGLGIRRDRIGLVQDDDLERGVGVLLHLLLELGLLGALPEVCRTGRLGRVADGQGGEVLDFVTDDRNAALVGGVELQNTALQLGGVPQRPAKGKGDGGLTGAGRTVKQEVGKAVRLDGILEGRHDLGLMRDVGEILGTILLYPRRCRNGVGGFLDRYHGCCLSTRWSVEGREGWGGEDDGGLREAHFRAGRPHLVPWAASAACSHRKVSPSPPSRRTTTEENT